MGISRDSRHKRSHTSAKRPQYRKKRKFELGRQPASTKLGHKRIHRVRVRGGNYKFRAMRLDTGNFSWGSESCTCKTRVLDVVYNASNNELVRTKTLVRGAIIEVDATPFRLWYESHYAKALGRKAQKDIDAVAENLKSKSKSKQLDITARAPQSIVESGLQSQFVKGRLYAFVDSRPGQVGRCDGHILEGKELEFYHRKLTHKR